MRVFQILLSFHSLCFMFFLPFFPQEEMSSAVTLLRGFNIFIINCDILVMVFSMSAATFLGYFSFQSSPFCPMLLYLLCIGLLFLLNYFSSLNQMVLHWEEIRLKLLVTRIFLVFQVYSGVNEISPASEDSYQRAAHNTKYLSTPFCSYTFLSRPINSLPVPLSLPIKLPDLQAPTASLCK